MTKIKYLVVGGYHINTLGLIRSLGETGRSCDVILGNGKLDFCYLRFSKYIKNFYMLGEHEDFIDVLKRKYENETSVFAIVCASDLMASQIDAHYNELKDHFVLFNAGEQGRICRFMNKLETFPIAEAAGLDTIQTWHVVAGEKIPSDIVYPCLIKGNNSVRRRKKDMCVCADEQELKAHLKVGEDTLVQEYIQKEYEIDVNGISINHGADVLLCGAVRKIREKLDRQSEFLVLVPLPDGLDVAAIRRFVKMIGYEGLFSVEFMKQGGRFRFLEMNLRNDAMNYLYTQAGLNMPALWAQYAEGVRKDFADVQPKIKTPLYLMQLSDVHNIKEGKVGLGAWVKDFLRSHGHFVMQVRDSKPFLYFAWICVRQIFNRVIKSKINIFAFTLF